jgi:hypothetical protein
MRPSSESASLSVVKGNPVLRYLKYGAFNLRASSRMSPRSTSMPACRRIETPPPDTLGFGSSTGMTVLAIPAATIASVHGGVLPEIEHGSSVTYRVAPNALDPASASAFTSACALP